MYFYKFKSIDYEQQEAFELMHWKRFSSEELDEMVKQAIAVHIENGYETFPFSPCFFDIGDLFFDGSLQDTLVREFGFKRIDFESSVSYAGEPLFRDNSCRRGEVNFKEILRDVRVPECESCFKDECSIENQRF
jgi:hypothetical protein